MKLRPMTMADADKMLEWKNYPDTMAFSILSKTKIDKFDHDIWLKTNLSDFHVIADTNDVACGAIRINNREISVWVDKAWRNRGFASYMLLRLAKKDHTAKIVPENIASLRTFIRAGFSPIMYNGKYFIFRK